MRMTIHKFYCLIFAEIANYCPVSPSDAASYYTGSTNRTIYTYSIMGCSLGYMSAVSSYPLYYCGPFNYTNGVYTKISGDCIRMI